MSDIDIATVLTPMDVIKRLSDEGVRYVPTGLDHGTVTAIIEDLKFEITTLRKDVSTDGRHAVISFTTHWEEDAHRRDFTMNTLLASPEGMVFDPIGSGLEDLDMGRVLFVGDAGRRIAEDYLRILRFFRFHGQYGAGEADRDALIACREHSAKMSSLSRERITQEFLKIIMMTTAADVLDLMFAHDVLADVPSKDFKSSSLKSLIDLQERYDAENSMARLFLIGGMSVHFFERWMILSNAQKKEIEKIAAALEKLGRTATQKKIRELVYRYGNAITLQAYFLKLSRKGELPELEILDIARYWHAPVFGLSGNDLIAKGVSPGPEIGKALKKMEEKWILSDFKKTF